MSDCASAVVIVVALGVRSHCHVALVPSERIITGDFTPASGRAAAEALLARCGPAPLPFSALFCANDPMAIAAISVLAAAGLRGDSLKGAMRFALAAAPDALSALITIDLDRGTLRIPATGWREQNLARLHRSLHKLRGARSEAEVDRDYAVLRAAYDAQWQRGT